MKRYLFILFVISLACFVIAQENYFPAGKTWNLSHSPCMGSFDLHSISVSQMVIGDTTINDTVYQTITLCGYVIESFVTEKGLICVRQEGKKVFARDNNNKEWLLYDFSLQI